MQNVNTVAGLKNAIKVLEVEQATKGQVLKEGLSVVYESFMPVNILRNTLKKFFGKSDLGENLSGSAMGAAGGLLIKKIFIGRSGNAFKKLIGSLLQMGISNIVTQNADLIRSLGHGIIQYLFHERPAGKSRLG